MNELLTTMPTLDRNLELAKSQVKKDIQTQRITQDDIINNYLSANELGQTADARKDLYQTVDNIKMQDVQQFHKNYFSQKPFSYAIVASEKKIDMTEMKKLGEVKKLSLEEIFGF